MNGESYIRVTEAAAMLQVSTQTIRNMIESGTLTGRKIDPKKRNSPIRIPLSEINRYLQTHDYQATHSG
jgi:excisionase family DNA binding protein